MHVNQGNNVTLDEEAIRTLVYVPFPPPPPLPLIQELLNHSLWTPLYYALVVLEQRHQTITQSLPLQSGISVKQTLTAVATFLRYLHLRGRAANNGRSTDNVRSKIGFVRANP